jgi:outer membrane receptor protein involved in Fe transport
MSSINPYTGSVSAGSPVFYHQYNEVRELEQAGLYVQELISLGNTPNAVARNMASLWTDYTFDQGLITGLQVGGGVRYFGKSWAGVENTLRIPSYMLYDAMLGYDLSRVGLNGASARLNLNNLTDEKYVAACNSLNQCYSPRSEMSWRP